MFTNIRLGQRCLVSGLKGVQIGTIDEISCGMFLSCGKIFLACTGEEVGDIVISKSYATPL